MNKDTIVGIVGAAILVAAMVGVFKYEGAQTASTLGKEAFDVTWSTGTVNGPSASGTTDEGASTEETLEITQANLTRIAFTLKWADDVGAADKFRVTVTGPDGIEAQTADGDSGEITVTFDGLNTPPEAADVFGNDEADAEERLAGQYTKRKGTGPWTVTIELVEAGDQTVGPTDVVVTEDTANAWDLTTQLTHYKPNVSPKSN